MSVVIDRLRDEIVVGGEGKDANLVSYTTRQNAYIGSYAGLFLTSLGILNVITALIRSQVDFSLPKLLSYIALTIGSFATHKLSRRFLANRITTHAYSQYLVGYLWLLALYGIVNTLEDFADGEQIVTFLMYMVIANVIFVPPPIGVLMMVSISYTLIFLLGFSGGRLDAGSLVNFWLSGITIMLAGFVRFRECRFSARRERALEVMGSMDALTGLKNRMALRSDFEGLVGRDQYVVMADLDEFKAVNDTYGHEAGDVVLATYGKVLREIFGDGALYRYGGDEFLLFVPSSSVTSMPDMFDELRRRIASVDVGGGLIVQANTSAGWVQGVAKDASELRDEVHLADQRLYEHKRARKEARRMAGG